jgi:UDP-2,3-diacylglucosamine hydrolase
MTDKGIRIVMLTGNHDMWVGKYLTEECGIELYTTPQTFTLEGKKFYISHGDNTNIKGQPMLRLMNAFFRSKPLRFIASWIIHPDLFLKFGQWWSGSSRKSHSKDNITPKSLDFLIDYARNYKGENPTTDYILFGHMHYPYDHTEDDLRVLFLGCWEGEKATYAVMDDEGNIALKTF